MSTAPAKCSLSFGESQRTCTVLLYSTVRLSRLKRTLPVLLSSLYCIASSLCGTTGYVRSESLASMLHIYILLHNLYKCAH